MSRRCLGGVSAASPMAAGDGALSTRRRLRVAQRRRTAVVVCAEKSAEHDVPLLGRHGRRRRLQLCELAMQEPDFVARPRGRRKMGHRRRAPAEQRAAGKVVWRARRAWAVSALGSVCSRVNQRDELLLLLGCERRRRGEGEEHAEHDSTPASRPAPRPRGPTSAHWRKRPRCCGRAYCHTTPI